MKCSDRQFETYYLLGFLHSCAAIFLLAVFPVGCPAEIRRYRNYLIPGSIGRGARPYRCFAAAIKSRSLFRSFFPGLDSTPEATSTAYGSTVRIALAIFSEVSPPSSMTGLAVRHPSTISHAN